MLDPVQDIRSVASSTFNAAGRHPAVTNGQRLVKHPPAQRHAHQRALREG
ncbi:hypothetical protein [Paludibacterium denitrificans]|uniref:Uncharacterized protein n=1 Tax=Paludibacterium denitrificans TaxID=2675226 RepID=A0A844GCD1_9NEIS|nr:hypothetical protein [Paludibacterium denitrificans]MTD34206.1 hypothetical protein [Paludibacterium denitrificans]